MKQVILLALKAALITSLLWTVRLTPALASGVVGTGTPASCTEAALNSALAGGGTVSFNCGAAPHTIPFSGQKSINANTTIDGGGKITLDGQNDHRLFDVGAVLTLRNIVLTRGYFNGDGGAIRNNSNGALVLENSTIRNSRATFSGGAILSTGPLTITNSVLENNQALNGGALYPRFAGARTVIIDSVLRNNRATDTTNGWGGAILAWDGAPVTIEGSEITNNTGRSGGGIYNFANSVLTLRNDTRLRDNVAQERGGGLHNEGTATLTHATLSGNSGALCGGGIFNFDEGAATLADVTLSGNTSTQGGGICNSIGTATLNSVTLSGNTAGYTGGGFYNTGTATLLNVTLSSNTAQHQGGGFYSNTIDATATLTNVTLSGNSAANGGGGIARNFGSVTLKSTIVANSPAGGDCAGGVANNGSNLASDASCGFFHVPNVMLGPLANNGGPTKTHMPLAGSPAIDNGSGCPGFDQRGAGRPAGPACDIGAVEYGGLLPGGNVYLPLVER